MTDRYSEMSDEALSRVLAAQVRRHPAPPALRVAVTEALSPPRRGLSWWLSPALAAAGTALVMALFVVTLLPRVPPADPMQRLARAVVAEHTRTVLWGARHPEVVPAALPWLTRESGIGLSRVFTGDGRVVLEAAEPVFLEERRGLALHYRDEDGQRLSYVVVPARGLPMPDRPRVQVERWRPALLQESGFSVLVWKQGDLACFLVSDMGSPDRLPQFKDYFARVRGATEPVPAY